MRCFFKLDLGPCDGHGQAIVHAPPFRHFKRGGVPPRVKSANIQPDAIVSFLPHHSFRAFVPIDLSCRSQPCFQSRLGISHLFLHLYRSIAPSVSNHVPHVPILTYRPCPLQMVVLAATSRSQLPTPSSYPPQPTRPTPAKQATKSS